MMTEQRLAELRALAAKATPGPWKVNRFDNGGGCIDFQVQQAGGGGAVITVVCEVDTPRARQDAGLIAAAREAVPELLAEVARLRGIVARLVGDDEGTW